VSRSEVASEKTEEEYRGKECREKEQQMGKKEISLPSASEGKPFYLKE